MIDTHAHILKEYYEDLLEIIESIKDIKIISCGVDDDSNKETLELISKYTNIYGAIGIHPSEVSKGNSIKFIEDNIDSVVAIGEIGLDYYYPGDYELQKEIFIKQLDLAVKYNKAVIIHSRDSFLDTFEILKEYPTLKKTIHSFSYTYNEALKFIEIGCMLGVNGVITFKNADSLREVVSLVDIKYLLSETDSPYLTPVPYRGKRNDPSKVSLIVDKIAEIKGISYENVKDILMANAIRQFDLN